MASIINVVLDLVFVIEFNLAVKGVAIVTVMPKSASAILTLIYVVKKVEFLKISKKI